jgi:hypothetical protein
VHLIPCPYRSARTIVIGSRNAECGVYANQGASRLRSRIGEDRSYGGIDVERPNHAALDISYPRSPLGLILPPVNTDDPAPLLHRYSPVRAQLQFPVAMADTR